MNVVKVQGPRGKLIHLVPEHKTLFPLWESLCGIESKFRIVRDSEAKQCAKCQAKVK